jgi:hypothetical protein
MSLTLSGTNGVVGAGFTLDASGASVTAGVGTFSSIGAGTSIAAAGLHGTMPTINGHALTTINAANLVGVCTSGLTKTGGFGKILQVVQTAKTDVTSFTSNSSSTFADITGMSASITPSSSSSKILVSFVINVSTSTSDRNNSIKLLRDSTAICVGTEGTSLNVTIADKTFSNKYLMNFTHQFLDSPSTTSATTYKLQWACEGSGGNQTYYLNRKGSGTGEGTASTITLMEVEA